MNGQEKLVIDMTLDELLERLDRHDDGSHELSAEQAELTHGYLLNKIDAYKFKLDAMDDEASRYQSYIDQFKASKASCEARQAKMKERMVYAMQAHHADKLPGTMFQATIRKSQVVEISGSAVIAEVFRSAPQYIRKTTSYAWNKEVAGADMKAGKELPFAKLKDNFSPIFTIRKGT